MDASDVSALAELERWYHENCDGDWEHAYGIDITTMDNPGWDVKIDLHDTILEGLTVDEEHEGPKTSRELQPANGYDAAFDWYKIWTEGETYRAYCAPRRLGFVLVRFLEIAREAEARHGGYSPSE